MFWAKTFQFILISYIHTFLTNDLSSFLTNDPSSFLTNDLSSSRGEDGLICWRSKWQKRLKSYKIHRGEKMALFVGGRNYKNGQHLTIFPKRTRQRSIISVSEMFWALCRSKHFTLIPSPWRVPWAAFQHASRRIARKSVNSHSPANLLIRSLIWCHRSWQACNSKCLIFMVFFDFCFQTNMKMVDEHAWMSVFRAGNDTRWSA